MTRPATINFNESVPICAHCPCPVPMSCWFKLSVLPSDLATVSFEASWTDKGKVLALTCTEQLQKS